MPEKRPSPEEFKAAQQAAREANEQIEREKEIEEAVVQKVPLDPIFENKMEIKRLREEDGELRKRIKKLEEDVKNLKKGRRGGRYA